MKRKKKEKKNTQPLRIDHISNNLDFVFNLKKGK